MSNKNIPVTVVAISEDEIFPTDLDTTFNTYGHLRVSNKGKVFARTRDAQRAIDRTVRDIETDPELVYQIVQLANSL